MILPLIFGRLVSLSTDCINRSDQVWRGKYPEEDEDDTSDDEDCDSQGVGWFVLRQTDSVAKESRKRYVNPGNNGAFVVSSKLNAKIFFGLTVLRIGFTKTAYVPFQLLCSNERW